jgi:hypothetical protein
MLAERRADGLEDWVKEVEASGVAELKSFALGGGGANPTLESGRGGR